MKLTSTIWYDTNSEPPKNYIWYKDGKHWAYNNETKSWEETVIDEGVYTRIDGLEERIAALEELIPEGGGAKITEIPATLTSSAPDSTIAVARMSDVADAMKEGIVNLVFDNGARATVLYSDNDKENFWAINFAGNIVGIVEE